MSAKLTKLVLTLCLVALSAIGAMAQTPPTNLSATAVNDSTAFLTWTDNNTAPNELHFVIERGTSLSNFAYLDTVDADIVFYQDTTLSPGILYYYRVYAVFAPADTTADSDVASVMTGPPAGPGFLNGSSTPFAVTLNWSDLSPNESGFVITRSIGPGYTPLDTVPANDTTFTDNIVVQGATYNYYIFGYNLFGTSDTVGPYTVTIPFSTPPAAPSTFDGASFSPTTMNLTWADNSGDEDGFVLLRRTGLNPYMLVDTIPANSTGFGDFGLAGGTSYDYELYAYNAFGNSSSVFLTRSTLAAGPVPPTNLIASSQSTSTILLTWDDNSSDETGFGIERSMDGVSWALIANVPANDTTYLDNGLAEATAYYYRVYAYNGNGNSAYSNVDAAVTFGTLPPPNAPSNLVSYAVDSTTVNVFWVDNSNNEQVFFLERSVNGTGAWSVLASLPPNTTSYIDTGLTKNTYYCYRVRAYNTYGFSSYSNYSCAYPSPSGTAPNGASNLGVYALSPTSMQLYWNDLSSTYNETGFVIERSLTGTGNWSLLDTVASNSTAYVDTGLVPSTFYCYRVYAYNMYGVSGYSNVSCATTGSNSVAPNAPSNLIASTYSESEIKLTWVDNSTNEDQFEIQESLDGVGGWSPIFVITNTTSYTVTGLAPNTAYYYRIRANNIAGSSAFSNTDAAITAANNVVPVFPTNLAVSTLSTTSLFLTWEDNSNNENGYYVERSPNGTGSWTVIATKLANSTTHTDNGLTPNTSYYYRVRAFNAAGNSNYSNTAVGYTTSSQIPSGPTNLNATTLSANSIYIYWTDNAVNESGYAVERSVDGVNWALIATGLAPNSMNFTDNGLVPNSYYYYRVYAYNATGNSPYSNLAFSQTYPNAAYPASPTELVAGLAGSNRIALSWTDNANNEQGFVIQRSENSGAYITLATLGANVQNFLDNTVYSNSFYCYRVYAYNISGYSGFTNTACQATPNTSNAPLTPTSLRATAQGNRFILLNWNDNANNELQYRVERSADTLTGYSLIRVLPANSNSYLDTNTVQNMKYYYRVNAQNDSGYSAYSNIASAVATIARPATPSNLRVLSKDYKSVNLAWNDNSTNETGFYIERFESIAAGWHLIASLPANTTTYTDGNVTPQTPYYYRMYSAGAGGLSVSYSNDVYVETGIHPLVPPAPYNLTAVVVDNYNVQLNWVDTTSNEDGFIVERSFNGMNGWEKLDTLPANTTSYYDANLLVNTGYFYQVRAGNIHGLSDGGNIAYARTADPNATGIAKLEVLDLIVYPNPAKDMLTIEGLNTSAGMAKIEAIDIHGRVVASYTVNPLSANVQLNGLADGLYQLRITQSAKAGSVKVMILH